MVKKTVFRSYGTGNSRYGFTGGEKINEVYGEGNYVDIGERGVDTRLGRLNWRIDPDHAKYPYSSPYTYAANNPIRYIDIDGRGPGDVVVAFSGADLFSDGDVATAGDIARQVVENSPGTSAKAFVSTFWNVRSGGYTPYGGSPVIITKETNFDKITQDAYDYIMKNKTDDGEIVIYGYSHGGVLANHLAKRLKKTGIAVNLLVTVDAARGFESDEVDREVSDNVEKNVNYYQTTPSTIGSRGDANTAENIAKTKVENINLTAKDVNHGNIDEKTTEQAVNVITDIVK